MSIYTIAPATWTNDLPVPNANTFNKEIHDRLTDIDTNVADKTTAQTLTNKTLTSPVINAPTGDVVTKTDAQTLTNKTLTSPVITGLYTWVDWVPNGSGAILSGYETAKYAIVGKILHYHFYAYNRNLSGVSNPITINLPFASVLNAIYQSTLVYNGSAWDHAQTVIGLNGTALSIFKTLAGDNWVANETGLIISVNGNYGIS